jgi:hypothetical protein
MEFVQERKQTILKEIAVMLAQADSLMSVNVCICPHGPTEHFIGNYIPETGEDVNQEKAVFLTYAKTVFVQKNSTSGLDQMA